MPAVRPTQDQEYHPRSGRSGNPGFSELIGRHPDRRSQISGLYDAALRAAPLWPRTGPTITPPVQETVPEANTLPSVTLRRNWRRIRSWFQACRKLWTGFHNPLPSDAGKRRMNRLRFAYRPNGRLTAGAVLAIAERMGNPPSEESVPAGYAVLVAPNAGSRTVRACPAPLRLRPFRPEFTRRTGC